MHYCSTCQYWIRNRPSKQVVDACPNCRLAPKKNQQPEEYDSSSQMPTFLIVLGFLMFCASLMFESTGALLGLLSFCLCGVLWWTTSTRASKAREARVNWIAESPKSNTAKLRERLISLKAHAKDVQDALNEELGLDAANQSPSRVELLQFALEDRENRIHTIEGELWARSVQFWLNQLEGFLAQKLPGLNQSNSRELSTEFDLLIHRADYLMEDSRSLEPLEPAHAKARDVLANCLEKAPEMAGRVKDARALALVGKDWQIPAELEAGSLWLHWLEHAIPTIELLPLEFSEYEDDVRIHTELRMMRDRVQFSRSPSMDGSLVHDAGSRFEDER